jgi:hypothetical protein
MRVRVYTIAISLGALAATPCLALTIQGAPPRPDVAQHLRSGSGSMFGGLPSEIRGSYLAPGRPGDPAVPVGTTSVGFGPVRATTTVTPGYDGSRYDVRQRDSGNPLSLTLPR